MIGTKVACPYCDGEAVLTRGSEIYTHRPDLHHLPFYHCARCKAWVGCHPKTTTPLGKPANSELRHLRSLAHSVFDRSWRTNIIKRKDAYRWLARKLDIPFDECHFGSFNTELCQRAIAICNEYRDGHHPEAKPFNIKNPFEVERLIRDLHGYMKVSVNDGTDLKGRAFALDALRRLVAVYDSKK